MVILGVIATFTIPKVLTAQQDTKFKAIAKESVSMVSAAYDAYKRQNTPGTGTNFSDLTPYMNYVTVDTLTPIDDLYGNGTVTCVAGAPCLRLHNGATLMSFGVTFNNTQATNVIYYHIDPDGKVTDGTTTGPGKAVQFLLYYNGRVSSSGDAINYCGSNGCTANGNPDPPWFNWN